MLNRELILYDGSRLYPAYLTPESRMEYVQRFGDKTEYLRCGCRSDTALWYRFAVNGKLYPEHNNYAHAKGCIFEAADRRERAFIQNAETGETRVFLAFKPGQFSPPSENETDEPVGFGKLPFGRRKNDGLNYYVLENFVKQLNSDTFNERMALGKGILSKEYFMSSLFGRLKNITIDGCRKTLREYTLQDDRWQFFYTEFVRYEMKETKDGRKSCSLIVKDRDGREYSWFIFEKTLSSAVGRFTACFGEDPNESRLPIVMSGFRYVKNRKMGTDTYRVVGRLYLAPVNRNGIIGRNIHELESLDAVCGMLRDKDLKFFIGDVGDSFWGYFEKKGVAEKLVIAYPESEFSGKNVFYNDFERKAVGRKELEGFLSG